ncbi:hypothetical protein C5Y96_10925 [Blastopirellula marina]|uniref:HEAT repeat domain-containing protein n=1 Tax=Blastopirellula marina TaxID=124 RepID=A0A2S8FMK6_9BACT|nr:MULTISPECIES: HEAT repeat domain-containing protein [Pirellulaceae]PQO33357.1 hypothetical protein C5Y96_10925 [Blastopirellula marina]RCS52446.1 HEAT repeat domain-containing protein [Bremerella cremea]
MNSDELITLYRAPDSVPPVSALADVDSVDWSAVDHAYGPATDVPALLRAMTSTESTHRDYAMQTLFQTIWHQGTIYAASAKAVPFLLKLLEADGPHDKAAVAYLLASLAEGQPSFFRCENNPEEAARWREILAKSNRSLDEEMAAGRIYHADLRQQIGQQLDLLYPYLRDPHPEVRQMIVVAIGTYPEIVKRVVPNLKERLDEEPDPYVRESLQQVIESSLPGS